MKELIELLEKSNLGKIEKNVKLSKYTTYKTGGKAKVIVYPKNATCLVKLLKILKNNEVKFKILGNGSNVLFSDKTYDGVLIRLNEFDRIIGLEKLKAIHLNDSKNPLGAHKDRHEVLGEGYIGLNAIEYIINNPKVRNLPIYLETPNEL